MWKKIKKPILALAPMTDYTDGPFCSIARQIAGSSFVIFREMVSAEAIVRGNEKTLRMCEFDDVERPIVQQIFGSDPGRMAQTAQIVVDKFKTDGIDINMGCPVPKIAKKGHAGADLMRDHDRAVAIVKALKKANLGVPVSVKTRLGWSRDDEILEFAPKLEEAGVDLITIHGRTKKQGYSGEANWERIGEVKTKIKIPVIANGDVRSRGDVERCLEITGADGVMIGRGALGNPWIFKKLPITNYQLPISLEERIDVVLRHANLHEKYYGNIISLRKHLIYYFKGLPGMKMIKQELVKVSTVGELESILQKIPR